MSRKYQPRTLTAEDLVPQVVHMDAMRIPLDAQLVLIEEPRVTAPPLIFATAHYAQHWVQALLSRGADVNALDSTGGTALDWAMTSARCTGIRELLIRAGGRCVQFGDCEKIAMAEDPTPQRSESYEKAVIRLSAILSKLHTGK